MQAGRGLLFRRQCAKGHGSNEAATSVRVLVVQGQQMRNIQTHRAMADAVMASCAWHRTDREHFLSDTQKGFHFSFVQSSIFCECGKIFRELLLI